MLPKLYTVIVNWKLWPDTVACVESLLAAGATVEQVVIVDNGSQDDSVARLRAHFGEALPLIVSPQNLGFGRGSNLGIEFALRQGAEWVLLLNNDTLVAPTFLSELFRAVVDGPQYAVFGPLILYHRQPQRVWQLGDRRLLGSLITRSLYRDQPEPAHLPVLLPVDFLTGCGLLVRADVFSKIHAFDPDLFMYGEDVDFCWRVHLSGFQLAAAPRAKMWHKVAASSNRDRPAARYWRIRNQIRFYRRYCRAWQLPLMVSFTAARALRLAVGDVLSGQPSLLRPLVQAWFTGWFMPARAAHEELAWNW